MLRGSSPFGWSSGYPESLGSSVTALDDASSDLSALSRPSAKSIYNQRKEYASSVNRQMHQFQHRVEHLFTFKLDGQELRDVNDCVERLKYLDAMGRVWGQDVMLEVQDGVLLLADIETKMIIFLTVLLLLCVQEVLESWALNSILDLKAILDERVYDSLLTVSIQERSSRPVSVFLFQSESLKADFLKKELERLLQNKKDDHRMTNGSKATVENVAQRNSRRESPPPQVILQKPPEPWDAPDYDDSPVPTPPISRNNSTYMKIETPPPHEGEQPPPRPYTERERNVDILNHLINDIEAFSDRLTAVAPKMNKKKKKKKKHKSEREDCTKWPEDDDDIPTYTPVFDDGWEPPDIRNPEPSVKNGNVNTNTKTNINTSKREPARAPVTQQMSNKPPLEPENSSEELPASFMRAIFDFTARNNRELSISKGEQLQLLDMSKQWWKVRNEKGQIGYVPNNMLQPPQQQDKPEAPSVPTLTRKSRPEEVRAWLEHKGFNKITVRCLGGISGSMLLGMTRDELKTICPEEGGRVFYQLQNVKSALAANEVRPMI
ncbi:epidermal growth factor receptor kinase substrate 8 3 [Labeo rohita]|uniref:Epidermal growth factor receptor kinase substrate 8 3 n=1 Tax=Labeo rohita TaxID=84645 RepID=A0A498MCV1_LABRO|nr:epidermal growth factor receptor kinase substrate 8 3 [Labeo rohita]